MSIAIIWWWAAGLMCAATLLESGYSDDIYLFDKNPHLGAKVIISGGGRCNVTTSFYRKEILKTKYPRGRDFIEPSITAFGPKKIYKRFSDHDVPLKIEKDGRVFPVSNNGKDVVWIFEQLFVWYHNLKLCLGERITSVIRRDSMLTNVNRLTSLDSDTTDSHLASGWQKRFTIVSDKCQYHVDNVVITTGWNAYRHTWSTGDGYAFAQSLWHSITKLWPSLNSFESDCAWIKELSWLSFPESQIIAHDNQRFDGPLLLTHFGMSGPMIFAYSAHVAFELCDKKTPLVLRWKPIWTMSFDTWMKFLQDQIMNNPKKQIDGILKQLFPLRFVHSFLYSIGIGSNWIMNTLTKHHLKVIAKELGEGIEIIFVARRAGDEFVTAGGVSTNEIDPLTMESSICSGLYFAGEIINVDGITWWYNLTSSRASGYIAGKGIIWEW